MTTYQAFEHYSAAHVKSLGLTMTQFDVIATLGNQPPMSCKDLGNKTLVSKGTLTGVLERLEEKGYVSRGSNPEDARSQLVCLTKSGQKLFEKVFPLHMEFLGKAFSKLSAAELAQLRTSLGALKAVFN
ncbi:MAG: MarR family transcriptional regulator [Polynucleobacter sp.]|nr:MarR family transcriptional regulator [Polynucleobacter sp.]